jgi:hypothetical protein
VLASTAPIAAADNIPRHAFNTLSARAPNDDVETLRTSDPCRPSNDARMLARQHRVACAVTAGVVTTLDAGALRHAGPRTNIAMMNAAKARHGTLFPARSFRRRANAIISPRC